MIRYKATPLFTTTSDQPIVASPCATSTLLKASRKSERISRPRPAASSSGIWVVRSAAGESPPATAGTVVNAINAVSTCIIFFTVHLLLGLEIDGPADGRNAAGSGTA